VSQAVPGASLSQEQRGEFICARATSGVLPGVFARLTVDARSCALAGGQ